jgi:serine/threonine protein kinase
MIGKTLVHYEISAQIGRGGMGEVYQAKDTKLGRDVGIKVLPEEFARDADRVTRFQREAKLLASLNHPNIAAIYGLEEADGTHFLVMELIEGDTLRDRIKSGPIPVEEALKLALQMAEALEAAHENGVIHRDLKPANIKVTPDGKVKILDFGLAKAYAGDQGNVSLADSPTISAAATQQGVILGTAAYMSPEQAKGKSVDKRADIWAFGVVLFEMLTGKSLFSGEDVSSTLARVLEREPDFSTLPQMLHPRIQLMLERCLKKNPKDRYSGISDARVDIQSVLSDASGVLVQPSLVSKPKKKLRVGISWILAATLLALVIGGAAIWHLKPSEPRKVMRFSYELPEDQQFTSQIQTAVSPDGSQFVYLTTDGLYLRSVDALDARLIAGTDRTSTQPVFSPDGRWIAYWSSNDRKLKKIAISGGVPVALCDTSMIVLGLTWSSDNMIVYSDVGGGGVKRVSPGGGTPESLFKAEFANITKDGMPIIPQMLPNGKTLLFTNIFSATNLADSQITLQSLESGERKVLVAGIGAMYLSTGHLVYFQLNNNIASLVAVPFDLDTMEVMGGPVPLLESISGLALSDSGTLLYVSGRAAAASTERTLVWVDREGKEEALGAPPNPYLFPNISPDGTRVALTVGNPPEMDIWIWDVIRKNLVKLTFHNSQVLTPIWTPDGKRIVYYSTHEGPDAGNIYWKAADGTGDPEKLATDPDRSLMPYSWSRDGKDLVMQEVVTQTNVDLSMLSMDSDRERKLLLQTEYVEGQPKISPDGQLMAYASDESGRAEVYVRRFPEVNKGKWQISTNGGSSPLWSPDGQELFYLSEDNSVMTVAVQTSPMVTFGTPKTLFQSTNVGFTTGGGTPWDIHPDGKRFLMMKPPGAVLSEDDSLHPKITIVLNWFEELKQRVPLHAQ